MPGDSGNYTMTGEQFRQMQAELKQAIADAKKMGFDQGRAFDQGAGGVHGADIQGGQYVVPATASNLSNITLTIPEATYANASVLWYGDLINQAMTATTTAVGVGTPAAATYTTTVVFSAPSWLTGPSGFFLSSASTQDKSYQLSVAYLYQNAAVFDVLNVTSSEDGQNAPVLKSTQIAQTQITPYGFGGQNTQSILNNTAPQNFSQNQLIVPLQFAMTLFHYLTFVTYTIAPTGGVNFTLLFNVLAAQHKARDFTASVQRGNPEMMSPQGKRLQLGPARS